MTELDIDALSILFIATRTDHGTIEMLGTNRLPD